ncbi:hypothetical protein ACFQX6_22870 [Streptosporangium lutulentum]
MAPIGTFLTIVLVILLFLLLAGIAGVYLLVKVGKKATKKARKMTTHVASQVAAMGPGDAAATERMRLDLRREVSLTRQAVDHALRDGWGLGDLPQLVAEIGAHADQLDAQLGQYAQHSRVSAYVDHASLDRLREHHAKLTTSCARIRADLLNDQMAHSAAASTTSRAAPTWRSRPAAGPPTPWTRSTSSTTARWSTAPAPTITTEPS